MSKYQHILIETTDKVGLITLNRPEAYNALNLQLLVQPRVDLLRSGQGAVVVDEVEDRELQDHELLRR